MPMKPHKGETQAEFMARCVPDMIGTGPNKRPQDQAVAACINIWNEAKKVLDVPEPEPDESYEDFMARCTDEIDDEEACQISWDNSGEMENGAKMEHKVTARAAPGEDNLEFILSDETKDRMGDVIMSNGWTLDDFKKNPICLFNHDRDFPIGKWKSVKVKDKQLRGSLELAPEGTSARIDEIRKLIEFGVLRAVSVGFRSLKREPLDKTEGHEFDGIRFLQ